MSYGLFESFRRDLTHRGQFERACCVPQQFSNYLEDERERERKRRPENST